MVHGEIYYLDGETMWMSNQHDVYEITPTFYDRCSNAKQALLDKVRASFKTKT